MSTKPPLRAGIMLVLVVIVVGLGAMFMVRFSADKDAAAREEFALLVTELQQTASETKSQMTDLKSQNAQLQNQLQQLQTNFTTIPLPEPTKPQPLAIGYVVGNTVVATRLRGSATDAGVSMENTGSEQKSMENAGSEQKVVRVAAESPPDRPESPGASNAPNQSASNAPNQTGSTLLAHASLPQRPSQEFDLRNLNLAKPGTCGNFKCLFELASDPRVGYLVATEDQLADLQVQWENGVYLKEEFGFQHLMLAPPTVFDLKSAALADHLSNNNARLIQCNNATITIPSCATEMQHEYTRGSSITIQKVEVLPQPNLLLGCLPAKHKHMNRSWDEFMVSVNQDIFVPNFTKAMMNLQAGMTEGTRTGELVVNCDFQAMLGADGNVYLIDISLTTRRMAMLHHPMHGELVRGERASPKCSKLCQDTFRMILSKLAPSTHA